MSDTVTITNEAYQELMEDSDVLDEILSRKYITAEQHAEILKIVEYKRNLGMVDPSRGWQYGFPTIWDQNIYPELDQLFDAMGYPDGELRDCPVRFWKPSAEHMDEYMESLK